MFGLMHGHGGCILRRRCLAPRHRSGRSARTGERIRRAQAPNGQLAKIEYLHTIVRNLSLSVKIGRTPQANDSGDCNRGRQYIYRDLTKLTELPFSTVGTCLCRAPQRVRHIAHWPAACGRIQHGLGFATTT